MDQAEFFKALEKATTTDEIAVAIAAFESANSGALWTPVGRENNRGTIEASSDPGRSLIERLTNGIDAVLEDENIRHKGQPECSSPREAAQAWLGVPSSGLSALSTKERQKLADRVSLEVAPGDGDASRRLVVVRDRGTGILPEHMAETILSLSESNKIKKRYVVGAYGQGGSSTFACSRYSFIASRSAVGHTVGFTVVKYYEPPPDDEAKVGNYVYLTLAGKVLEISTSQTSLEIGTKVSHFGYDLSRYSGALGPASVYGLLNGILFDPVMPVWLTDSVHKYRRVIKGSRNALNGAIDEGDEGKKGPGISHSVPMYFVDLGDMGSIGLEYWVLEAQDKQPIRAFVDPGKPIVLTLHGQSHAEMSQVLVRKDADLPYLRQRLICHVDCNRLTPGAKRSLFVSNREEARKGHAYSRIEDEVVRALRSDEELGRLNAEAREQGLQQQDQEAQKQMQGEVARLLRLQGISVEMMGGTTSTKGENQRPVNPGPPKPKPMPMEVKEPPSLLRIVWDEDSHIPIYPGQTRYLRIETDADSSYHNAANPKASRFNFIVTGEGLSLAGTTSLSGGRMRAIVRCDQTQKVGGKGRIQVELARVGLTALVDGRDVLVVDPPVANPGKKALSVPKIDPRRIDPTHPQWDILGWKADQPSYAASESEMENGTLVVWYSGIFPSFEKELSALEQKDPALAKSFNTRYAIWIAVHALLAQEEHDNKPEFEALPEGAQDEFERIERCRIGRMAAMIAMREVRELRTATE